MNKRIIIVIGSLVAVGLAATAGAMYVANTQSADEQNQAEMQRQAELPPKTTDEDMKNVANSNKSGDDAGHASHPGAYVNYSNTIIENTHGTKVLFFHAPWCPQCRAIETDIKAQSSLPDDTTIIKVDYDSNQSLRQKYGVTLQTTFVRVDDKGDLVKKYVAYNEPTYAAVKSNILD